MLHTQYFPSQKYHIYHVTAATVVIAVMSKLFKVHDMEFHITKHHRSGKIVHFSAVERSAREVTQRSILPKLLSLLTDYLKSTGFSTKIK